MSLTLNNIVIESREDGFINATQLCKAGGKVFAKWYRLDSTKELIEELEKSLNAENSVCKNLIEVKKGRYNSGSWIHPDLAVQLAQWISPKFSLKVSKWVNEWRTYSVKNEHKFIDALSSLEPSYNAKREKDIQHKLSTELEAKTEVQTPVGCIDLLTEDKVIEVKEYSKWKHAIGQVLCYGLYYKDKQKKIILFGTGDMDELIKETCNELKIEVEILE